MTSSSSFESAVALVLQHEGGFVNHPRDPGGATNFGITRETLSRARGCPVSVEDVRRLTRGEAASIYRSLYWKTVRADDLPRGLDLAVFDLAVNSGPKGAVTMLQDVLGVKADGLIGPVTIKTANGADPAETVWANLSGLVALVLGLFGFDTSELGTGAVEEAIVQFIAAASFIASMVFRILATKQILN